MKKLLEINMKILKIKIKKGRNTITTTIAYMAGFFDGEGCIRIKKSNQGGNSYHIIAHVTNSNKKILKQYEQLFGGDVRKQERTPNKILYNFYITSSEASDMLKVLLAFLQEKFEQAELEIEFHKMKEEMGSDTKEYYYKKISLMKKK